MMTNSNEAEAERPAHVPRANEPRSNQHDEPETDRPTEDATAEDDPDAPGLSVLGVQPGPPVEPNEPA
jgi:hypothetical protein